MAPKRLVVIAAASSKQERQRERRRIGPLKHQVIAPKTEERYQSCFESFLRFHRLQRNFSVPSSEVFDDMVAEFIEALWDQGEPKSQANYTLAAIQFYKPQVKHHLPWSWKLVKVWNTLELPQRATPLSPDLLMALSGQAFRWSQTEFGWLIIVGFTLFLRTGELLSIQAKDVVLACNSGVLYLPPSKGGKRNFLPLERVEITEKATLQAFRHLLRGKQPGGLPLVSVPGTIYDPVAFNHCRSKVGRHELLPVQPQTGRCFQCL